MARYKTDIRERAKDFAVEGYKLAKHVRQSFPDLRNASQQLFDASSSVGAHLAEGDGFNTRKELAVRYSTALKESRESLFWLEVMERVEPSLKPLTTPLAAECKELIAMCAEALKKLRP